MDDADAECRCRCVRYPPECPGNPCLGRQPFRAAGAGMVLMGHRRPDHRRQRTRSAISAAGAPDDLLGRRFDVLLPESDVPTAESAFSEFARGGTVQVCWSGRRRDGAEGSRSWLTPRMLRAAETEAGSFSAPSSTSPPETRARAGRARPVPKPAWRRANACCCVPRRWPASGTWRVTVGERQVNLVGQQLPPLRAGAGRGDDCGTGPVAGPSGGPRRVMEQIRTAMVDVRDRIEMNYRICGADGVLRYVHTSADVEVRFRRPGDRRLRRHAGRDRPLPHRAGAAAPDTGIRNGKQGEERLPSPT